MANACFVGVALAETVEVCMIVRALSGVNQPEWPFEREWLPTFSVRMYVAGNETRFAGPGPHRARWRVYLTAAK